MWVAGIQVTIIAFLIISWYLGNIHENNSIFNINNVLPFKFIIPVFILLATKHFDKKHQLYSSHELAPCSGFPNNMMNKLIHLLIPPIRKRYRSSQVITIPNCLANVKTYYLSNRSCYNQLWITDCSIIIFRCYRLKLEEWLVERYLNIIICNNFRLINNNYMSFYEVFGVLLMWLLEKWYWCLAILSYCFQNTLKKIMIVLHWCCSGYFSIFLCRRILRNQNCSRFSLAFYSGRFFSEF